MRALDWGVGRAGQRLEMGRVGSKVDVGEPPIQEPETWSWVLGCHAPIPEPPWQGRPGSAEGSTGMVPEL